MYMQVLGQLDLFQILSGSCWILLVFLLTAAQHLGSKRFFRAMPVWREVDSSSSEEGEDGLIKPNNGVPLSISLISYLPWRSYLLSNLPMSTASSVLSTQRASWQFFSNPNYPQLLSLPNYPCAITEDLILGYADGTSPLDTWVIVPWPSIGHDWNLCACQFFLAD